MMVPSLLPSRALIYFLIFFVHSEMSDSMESVSTINEKSFSLTAPDSDQLRWRVPVPALPWTGSYRFIAPNNRPSALLSLYEIDGDLLASCSVSSSKGENITWSDFAWTLELHRLNCNVSGDLTQIRFPLTALKRLSFLVRLSAVNGPVCMRDLYVGESLFDVCPKSFQSGDGTQNLTCDCKSKNFPLNENFTKPKETTRNLLQSFLAKTTQKTRSSNLLETDTDKSIISLSTALGSISLLHSSQNVSAILPHLVVSSTAPFLKQSDQESTINQNMTTKSPTQSIDVLLGHSVSTVTLLGHSEQVSDSILGSTSTTNIDHDNWVQDKSVVSLINDTSLELDSDTISSVMTVKQNTSLNSTQSELLPNASSEDSERQFVTINRTDSECGCLNGGSCPHPVPILSTTAQCLCPPGFDGSLCQRSVCDQSPCLNNGTCSVNSINGSAFCLCPETTTGQFCETTIGQLLTNESFIQCPLKCENNGQCVFDENGSPVCTCSIGYSGKNCNVRDVCQLSIENPCAKYGQHAVCRLLPENIQNIHVTVISNISLDASFECICKTSNTTNEWVVCSERPLATTTAATSVSLNESQFSIQTSSFSTRLISTTFVQQTTIAADISVPISVTRPQTTIKEEMETRSSFVTSSVTTPETVTSSSPTTSLSSTSVSQKSTPSEAPGKSTMIVSRVPIQPHIPGREQGYKQETNATKSGGWKKSIPVLVLVAVISVLLLVTAVSVILLRFIRRKRKLHGKYNPAKEESAVGSGQSLPMTDITKEERLI